MQKKGAYHSRGRFHSLSGNFRIRLLIVGLDIYNLFDGIKVQIESCRKGGLEKVNHCVKLEMWSTKIVSVYEVQIVPTNNL